VKAPARSTVWMPGVGTRIVTGLLPVWLLLLMLIAAPGGVYRLGDNPPAIVGLPVGILLVGIALVVMAIGVAILLRTSSTRSLLVAFLCFTVPAAVVMVAAPVLILMVQIWASRPPQ
jgi:hypothetical protein